MTHFCCLCTWSLGGFGWKSISSSHLSAHSFYPPKRGELMRKWLFQEVILDEASVFHFPFVPCLWNKEHKRKALSNLTGVSGIQLLGSSQLGFAWEEQRDWREEGRKEVGKLHHPTMDSLEDFSFSSNSQLISSYQKKISFVNVAPDLPHSKLLWSVHTSVAWRWSGTCRVFKAGFELKQSLKPHPTGVVEMSNVPASLSHSHCCCLHCPA